MGTLQSPGRPGNTQNHPLGPWGTPEATPPRKPWEFPNTIPREPWEAQRHLSGALGALESPQNHPLGSCQNNPLDAFGWQPSKPSPGDFGNSPKPSGNPRSPQSHPPGTLGTVQKVFSRALEFPKTLSREP